MNSSHETAPAPGATLPGPATSPAPARVPLLAGARGRARVVRP